MRRKLNKKCNHLTHSKRVQLRAKDLIFAGINGGIFGLLLPFVLTNLNVDTGIALPLFVIGFALLAICGVFVGYVLSKFKRFFFQLAKFGSVGVANTAIDFGILNVLIFFFGATTGIAFTIFKLISFIGATINSYVWNKFWSFEDHGKKDLHAEFVKFLTISGTGALLNVGVASAVNLFASMTTLSPGVWANIAAAVASVAVLAWNFLGYKFIVFKK